MFGCVGGTAMIDVSTMYSPTPTHLPVSLLGLATKPCLGPNVRLSNSVKFYIKVYSVNPIQILFRPKKLLKNMIILKS